MLKIQDFICSIQEHKPILCIKLNTWWNSFNCFFLPHFLASSSPNQIGICTNAVGEVIRSGNNRSAKICKGDFVYSGDIIPKRNGAFFS